MRYEFVFGVYLLWNLITMIIVGWDKYKARHHRWRIRERTLLGLACAMGGVGVFIGMQLFRHKTKHLKFTIGVPLAVVLNVVIAFLIWKYLI